MSGCLPRVGRKFLCPRGLVKPHAFQVKSDSETSLCEIESEDTFAEAQTTHRRVGKLADRHDLSMVGCSGGVRQADRQGKKDRPRLEVPLPKFLLLLLRCHLTAPIGNWQVQEKKRRAHTTKE